MFFIRFRVGIYFASISASSNISRLGFFWIFIASSYGRVIILSPLMPIALLLILLEAKSRYRLGIPRWTGTGGGPDVGSRRLHGVRAGRRPPTAGGGPARSGAWAGAPFFPLLLRKPAGEKYAAASASRLRNFDIGHRTISSAANRQETFRIVAI